MNLRSPCLVLFGACFGLVLAIKAQTAQSARAVEIVQEYSSNEVAAAQKYEGHRISIGGIVAGVGIDPDQSPYVVLYGTDRPPKEKKSVTQLRNYSGYLKCVFTPADNSKISQLRVGSATGFQGTVAGKFKGGVLAKDCKFP